MNFEENQVPEAILDKLTKVCTCRSITRKTIKEAILDGAHTFPQVKEATRAGTGACGGKGCGSYRKALSGNERARQNLICKM